MCELIIAKLDDNDKVYLHCWGGHGRTGLVASIVLGMVYGISSSIAMQYVQLEHDSRFFSLNIKSPQTDSQRNQVKRILSSERVKEFIDNRKLNKHQKTVFRKYTEVPKYKLSRIKKTNQYEYEELRNIEEKEKSNNNMIKLLPLLIKKTRSI